MKKSHWHMHIYSAKYAKCHLEGLTNAWITAKCVK